MFHPCKHSPNVKNPVLKSKKLTNDINNSIQLYKPDQMQSPKHQNYDRSNQMLSIFYHILHFW